MIKELTAQMHFCQVHLNISATGSRCEISQLLFDLE